MVFLTLVAVIVIILLHSWMNMKPKNFPPGKIRILSHFNLLKPTGSVMQQQFNIQQFYILSTLYLCVLYLSENKQRLVPLINCSVFITEMKSVYCAVRTGSLNKAVCASSLKGQLSFLSQFNYPYHLF